MLAGNRFVARYEPEADGFRAYCVYGQTRYVGAGDTFEEARASLTAVFEAANPSPDDARWKDPSVPGVPIPEED